MGRHRKNHLKITQLASGTFFLHGQVNGKQIRKWSRHLTKLQAKKGDLQRQIREAEVTSAEYRLTSLTDDELRAAEGLKRAGNGLSMADITALVERHRPPAESVSCTEALAAWLTYQEDTHLFPRTIANNRKRVGAFLTSADVSVLSDLTPAHCEAHVLRKGIAARTQVSDGRAVRAWLTYCVRKKMLRVSPFELDMVDLSKRARSSKKPVILTPAECERLVAAAASKFDGDHLPYVALALFMFLRHAEALRTTAEQLKLDHVPPTVEVSPRKAGTVSYRAVPVPANAVAMLRHGPVVWSQKKWNAIRKAAELYDKWDENILRHTGISYRYQQTGDIGLVAREAGNSSDVSFRHYIRLPAQGDSAKFYAITAHTLNTKAL